MASRTARASAMFLAGGSTRSSTRPCSENHMASSSGDAIRVDAGLEVERVDVVADEIELRM